MPTKDINKNAKQLYVDTDCNDVRFYVYIENVNSYAKGRDLYKFFLYNCFIYLTVFL